MTSVVSAIVKYDLANSLAKTASETYPNVTWKLNLDRTLTRARMVGCAVLEGIAVYSVITILQEGWSYYDMIQGTHVQQESIKGTKQAALTRSLC
jgi:hypothetical protein